MRSAWQDLRAELDGIGRPAGSALAWAGVEVRHLAALQSVAMHQSFRRAANALGYTQSAVSQQIATLERLVGARLVERAPGQGGVALTPAGEVVLHHAAHILGRLTVAETDVRSALNGREPVLTLGSCPGPSEPLAATLLLSLAESRAELDAEVAWREFSGTADLLDALSNGAVDVAIAPARASTPQDPFDVIGNVERPLQILRRSDSARAWNRTSSAGPITLVCYRTCQATEAALSLLRIAAFPPFRSVRTDDLGTMTRLLELSNAAALVPEGFLTLPTLEVISCPEETLPVCSVVAIVLRHRASPTRAGIEDYLRGRIGHDPVWRSPGSQTEVTP